MARALRPTKLQFTILATATGRTEGTVFPIDEQISDRFDEVEAAITKLLQDGLIAGPKNVLVRTWRDHMKERTELRITGAGRELTDSICRGQMASKRPTKAATVLTMLQRDGGASAAELMKATGWQAHTTRAALSALRKRGYTIERCSRDVLTCYRLAA